MALLKAGFHVIADDRGWQIAESSAIVCDHMETHFCDRLRSYSIVCDPAIIWKRNVSHNIFITAR